MSALQALHSKRFATLRRSRRTAGPSTTRVRCVRTMATLKAYVKGLPKENKLGDCPFSHRVLLTLEAKQVPYEKEYIDFADKPEWLLDPQKGGGKVPVINDGDMWMADSDKITEFLEEKFPEPSMKSDVPSEVGGKLFPAFRGVLFAKDDSEAAEKKAELDAELSKIDGYLATHGPFFGGDKLNATDAAVAPKLYHAKVALKEMKGLDVMQPYPAIQKYFEALSSSPAWQATDYGEDMIVKGWKNH